MPIFNKDKTKDKKESRREFRLSRIKERSTLLLAKAKRWKWLAIVIGLGLITYLVLKFT